MMQTTAAAAGDDHSGAPPSPPTVPGRRRACVSLPPGNVGGVWPTPPHLLAIENMDRIHGDEHDYVNVGVNGHETGSHGVDQHCHCHLRNDATTPTTTTTAHHLSCSPPPLGGKARAR